MIDKSSMIKLENCMDPQQLDPKLKEEYERIMNTPTPGGQTSQEDASQTPQEPVEESDMPSQSTSEPQKQPTDPSIKDNDTTSPWQSSGIPSEPEATTNNNPP